MGMWTAIVIIVFLGIISNMYRDYIRKEMKRSKVDNGDLKELLSRFEQMEKRMATLETIVLEQEKQRPFEDLKNQ